MMMLQIQRIGSTIGSRTRWFALLFFCLLFSQTMAQQKHGNGIDDVLQYVPYASVVGLKLCGVESRDDWVGVMVPMAASWVMAAGVTYSLKHTVKEWRPDDSDQRSFPSGHAAIAFAGATMLCKEYAHVSPWIAVAGYGVATVTAVDRVAKERHHWYDVAAGAGIGVLSGELTYYLSRKVLKTDQVGVAFAGSRLDVAICW